MEITIWWKKKDKTTNEVIMKTYFFVAKYIVLINLFTDKLFYIIKKK